MLEVMSFEVEDQSRAFSPALGNPSSLDDSTLFGLGLDWFGLGLSLSLRVSCLFEN